MPMIAVFLNIDEQNLVVALEQAGTKLNGTEGEAVIDLCSVRRIGPGGLRAMEEFGRIADAKAVKVVLRGVNVDVYKVLKLAKLTGHFSFVNCDAALAGRS